MYVLALCFVILPFSGSFWNQTERPKPPPFAPRPSTRFSIAVCDLNRPRLFFFLRPLADIASLLSVESSFHALGILAYMDFFTSCSSYSSCCSRCRRLPVPSIFRVLRSAVNFSVGFGWFATNLAVWQIRFRLSRSLVS